MTCPYQKPRNARSAASRCAARTWNSSTYIPGTTEAKRRKVSEWVCPECEYFEEIEGEGRK